MNAILKEFQDINVAKKVLNNSERKLKKSKSKIKIIENYEYRIGNYLIKQTLRKVPLGEIRLGIYIPSNEKVSVKIIDKSLLTEKDKIRLKREFEVSSIFNHPNVILTNEIFESEKSFYNVMEFIEKFLSNYLNSKKRLSETKSALFYFQLIQGLEYIHSKGIIHNNLNLDNLIIIQKRKLKITDFSFCNYFTEGQNKYLAHHVV